MPSSGTVFQIIPEGGNHFWIVISEVMNGKVLAVNVTDAKHCQDSPCKIGVGDHPVIEKPSAVHYRKAREFDARLVDDRLAAGTLVRQLADCTPELLNRIIEGARIADDLTMRFLD